ncbi:hypothetical protein BHE74_00055248, partial [Ensete ventricosum]
RRITRRRKKSRFSSSSPSSSFSLPWLRLLLFFFSLFFFLPPSAKRPLEIGRQWSKSTVTDRFRVVMDGNNRYLAVIPSSEQSAYQSADEPVCPAQYEALPLNKINIGLCYIVRYQIVFLFLADTQYFGYRTSPIDY